ncbi:MAG: YkgJ family cysteine cluster protein [Candidatus Tritonobacter lacicola]|nr:YkgJ family cysteine cluster protein [Candidatus Tritonobacter lacicola]
MRCAECCSWRGYVYLTEGEVKRVAAFLGIGIYDFTERYTRLSDDRLKLSLKEKENGECVFLEGKTCSVYPVRPEQCAEFPMAWSVDGLEHICAATMQHHNN